MENIKYFVEAENAEKGCSVLSKEYGGYNEKLDLLCRCGRIFQAIWRTSQFG